MLTKEESRKAVKALLDTYHKLESSGELLKRYGKGKEANTKKDFIEPLFEALNWMVRDSSEVSAEEAVVGGEVDYGFFVDGISKFFVEAKPIGEPLIEKHKKQALNYGINRCVPLVVLTNFKEVMVFGCEWREDQVWKNQLSTTIDIFQLFENFDDLWLLSKNSFLDGSVDKYLESKRGRRPRQLVNDLLLQKMLEWRRMLTNDLSRKCGAKHAPEDIDEHVQRLLVRFLFIRNCEDRNFEEPKLLPAFYAHKDKKKNIVRLLHKIFDHYDQNYDSSLFRQDDLDKVEVDDSILSKVLWELYFTPEDYRYNFKVIPKDIMGHLYEQYLGHVLKKPGTKLKAGTAHRKEQGIYYTPTYIVDYIVKNTLGELLKEKKVDPEKLRVLDPACGSGSFLIRAFDVLNDYWAKKDKDFTQTRLDVKGEAVTYSRKVKILQDNIFGVDLDRQAVEIAQLNLLLKLAEKRQRLPVLEQNIKCGNSLIDNETVAGDKAFKWEDQFKDIIKQGGFDVVIGNPPYISNWSLTAVDRNVVKFLERQYSDVAYGHWDIYILFIRKAFDLLKEGGFLSFIVPSSFAKEKYGLKLREFITKNFFIVSLAEFGTEAIFEGVARQYVIFVVQKKTANTRKTSVVKFRNSKFEQSHYISQNNFLNFHNFTFRTDLEDFELAILNKISSTRCFIGNICCVNVGVVAHSKASSGEKFRKKDVISDHHTEGSKKYVEGKDISRYSVEWNKHYLDYGRKKDFFHRPKFPELFESDKIIIRRVSGEKNSILAAFDDQQLYTNDNLIIIVPWNEQLIKLQSPEKKWRVLKPYNAFSLKYLLGILNSKLIAFYFSKMIATGTLQGTYTGIYPEDIRSIPIKHLAKSEQESLITLVDSIRSLHKTLRHTPENSQNKEEIKKTDSEIDAIVYKLYGITESEKKIIEESLNS
ncbi:N-6 DNA methylase [Candidatus Woesearchaeota archaeon]|nr:N-6 DNA methylase [Candidatus Woesearchaeota archaeon]